MEKTLKDEIDILAKEIKSKLGFITFYAVIHKIKLAISRRIYLVKERHEKKLNKYTEYNPMSKSMDTTRFAEIVINNYSAYNLSNEEKIALSYGLDDTD